MTDTDMEGRVDAAERKPWYGEGEQPWDTAVRLGWGPAFAAANVLKYVRRIKAPEHSRRSAQAVSGPTEPWQAVLFHLEDVLSQSELRVLRGEP